MSQIMNWVVFMLDLWKIKVVLQFFLKSGLAFKEMDVSKYILEVDCEVAAVKLQELNLVIVTTYRSPRGSFDNFTRNIDNLLLT